jgi:hypothetical protein
LTARRPVRLGEFMGKMQKTSLNHRRFLKVAAGSGAAFVAGNQVAAAQQVRHGYSGYGGVEVGAPRIATTALSYTAFAKYVRQPMRSMPRYATEAQLPEVALTDIYAFLKSIPAPPDSKSVPLLQNN